MNWTTVIWLMVSGICLGMAIVFLMVWFQSRQVWSSLFFFIGSISAAWMALIELRMMHTPTAAESGALLGWYSVSVSVVVVALVWFVRAYLRAGSLWLAWLITGLRVLSSILNFLPGRANTLYLEMDVPRHVALWGETLWVPSGLVRSQWWHLNNASSLLFLVFLAGALITTWRRGDRHRVMALGGALGLAFCFGLAKSIFIFINELTFPYSLSLVFLIIVVAMIYELSTELVRSAVRAQQLRQSEQRMRLAADAADLELWEWNIERDDVWTMRAKREQSGIAYAGRVGLDRYLEIIHPTDRARVREAILTAREGEGNLQDEFRIVNSAGDTRWISVRGQVETRADGQPQLMRGISQDITERKRTEAELRERSQELAHFARVSTLGQLASALAHEINQPLGAILRNAEAAELLLRKTPPDLDEVRAIVKDIQRDEKRAVSVIDRMRSLLKNRELHLEELTVEDLIVQVAELLHTEMQTRHASLELDVPRTLPKVRCDRVHLQQVILNLLLNGLDALEDSEGERRQIIIRASHRNNNTIEIAVSDCGKGIPSEELPRLFEPFFTTKATGTGIGLAISRTIVEMHGGQISAENNPEGGATIRFTLDAAKQETGA